MPQLLKGTALITGAGSGIGRAVALACARDGCRNIILADVNPVGAQETEDLIRSQCQHGSDEDVRTVVVSVDVSNPESVAAMVSRAVEAYGGLDYAYNVAGISVNARVSSADYPIEEFDSIQSINARGLLLCTQAEVRVMLNQTPSVTIDSLDPRRAQRGSIVNIASTCASSVIPDMLPYIVSKHAVLGITRATAIDHASDMIRVNAVCPGLVETPMIEQRRNQLRGREQQQQEPVKIDPSSWTPAPIYSTPQGRLALPEEVADTCVFLSSSMSSHITASFVMVDGGRSAVY